MKTCISCKESKELTEFTKRPEISKKTGKPLYKSKCKKCLTLLQNIRNRGKRKRKRNDFGTGKCAKCGMDITNYAVHCTKCSTPNKKQSNKEPIDEKWLRRGPVSNNTSNSSIMNGSD